MNRQEDEIILEELKGLPTGNISDAMDELGMTRSVITGLPCVGNCHGSAAGYALTIRQARRSASSGKGKLALQGKVIDEQTKPGDIIVIDTSGIQDVSTGGAIQMLAARNKGAKGYITNGSIRDLDEIRELDFPVFAVSSSPIKSTLDIETIGINVPVTIGNTQVKPGDLLVMDSTGIIVIPADRAAEVVKKAKAIQEREERMLDYLKQGIPLVEARELAKK